MVGVGTMHYKTKTAYVIVSGNKEYIRFSDVCNIFEIKHPWKVLRKWAAEPQSAVTSAGELIEDFGEVVEPISEHDLFINTWMLSAICAAYNMNNFMVFYIDFIKEGHEMKEKQEEAARSVKLKIGEDVVSAELSSDQAISVLEAILEALSDE